MTTESVAEEIAGLTENIRAALRISGDLTPAQITADQNDYNPTGLANAAVLRLNSNASRNITGLAGGVDGRILILHNVGANPIVLKDESASSVAANRFALAVDFTLDVDEVVLLHYDSTSSRWRLLGIPNVAVQVFTTSGTWTKPPGAKAIRVTCIGGGGGGGSGRRGLSASTRSGGGGGGGGGFSRRMMEPDNLAATVTVTIGAKGTGGAAQTVNDTNGNPGTNGGNTSFGAYDVANGGAGGAGGAASNTTNAAGGAPANPLDSLDKPGATGGQGKTTLPGGDGTATGTANGAPGGAAGGGITTGDVSQTGGTGGAGGDGTAGGALGGVGANGGAGTAAPANTPLPGGGGGGGGAATNNVSVGKDGGGGGLYGAGGGGGGGSYDPNNSGKGGDGADGICIVETFF